MKTQPYSAPELRAKLEADAPPLLLDVREYPEFAAGQVAGSRLLPLAEVESRGQHLPKASPEIA